MLSFEFQLSAYQIQFTYVFTPTLIYNSWFFIINFLPGDRSFFILFGNLLFCIDSRLLWLKPLHLRHEYFVSDELSVDYFLMCLVLQMV